MTAALHFAPARGWLNDPNGLIEHHGVHHLFFQHNPTELAMTDMCWGHASSTDLITWTEHPVALRPGPAGSYDGDGCWSGCAVAVDEGDRVFAIYSGNDGGIQLPCVARALDEDLVRWEKSPHNPVIEHRPPVGGMTEMRDHSVRRDGALWRQVLAAGAAGEGLLVGYSSPDLIDWTWDGVVLESGEGEIPGQVWECPDVFEVDGHALAIISVIDGHRRPGPVIWVTGRFDGPRITPLRWGLLDHGDRLYAPQSYFDHTGRRIMFGWLLTQLDPAARGKASIGMASLPRVLSVVGGRLHQRPAAEIERLRAEPATVSALDGSAGRYSRLVDSAAVEVELTWAATDDLLGASVEFADAEDRRMVVDLARFGGGGRVLGSGSAARGDTGGSAAWEPDVYEPHTATVIFDSGIVEIFLDDGRAAALTDARLETVTEVRVRGTGRAPVRAVVWPLRPTAARVADPVSVSRTG